MYLTLNDFERRLDPERFIRVHRAHIVNLDFVKQLVPFDGSRMQVEMRDGTIQPALLGFPGYDRGTMFGQQVGATAGERHRHDVGEQVGIHDPAGTSQVRPAAEVGHDRRAVLALFHHQELRPPTQDPGRRPAGVRAPRR